MAKHTRHGRRSSRRRSHRGAGYGFGGSILSDAGGANAGNAQWNADTSKDCGAVDARGGNNSGAFTGGAMPTDAHLLGRGGNNPAGGRRSRRSRRSSRSSRRAHRRSRRSRRGGMLSEAQLRAGQLNPELVQTAPRTGYTFDGSGVAGTVDPVRA